MKKLLTILVFRVLIGAYFTQGGQLADLHLYCLSLRAPQASASMLGLNYILQFTTESGQNPAINNELMPDWSSSSSALYISRFALQSDAYPEPITGTINLYIPPFTDNNSNGFSDFFEVLQPISPTQTAGVFIDDLVGDEGKVTAIWTRNAGQRSGSCQMKLVSSFINLTFPITFEIMEYDGALNYSMASGSVSGSVNLALALSPADTLGGQIALQVLGTNDLTLLGGVWTNASGQSFTYLATSPGDSIGRYDTNYFGYFEFKDGDPVTGQSGYTTWILNVNDANDQNRNGIPDLSDLAPSAPPRLSLTFTNRSLLLSVEAEAGRSCQIERVVSLTSTNWLPFTIISLTNNNQTVNVPIPNEKTSFWRAYLLKY